MQQQLVKMRQGMVAVVIPVGWVGPLLGTQFQGEWVRFGCWTGVSCLLLFGWFPHHCLNCCFALGHFLGRPIQGLFRRIDLPQVLYLLDRRLSCDRST